MIVPTVWLPALPPVPIRSGMNASNSMSGKRDVALHDVLDPGQGPGEDQALERDEPDEPALGVDDVAVIDRLAVGGLVAEPLQGFANDQVGRERDVVGRHDRAGSPGLVTGQAADVLAFGLRQVGQDVVDMLLVEPLDQVGPFVVRHHVEQAGCLARRHRPDDPDLAVGVEIAEHLRPQPVREQTNDAIALARFEILEHLGDVGGMVFAEEVT
jgi:hypothetical protein